MRHQSREIALQILFQNEFGVTASVPQIMGLYESTFDKATLEYAQELVEGTLQNQKTIDALIESKAAHWKLQRMPLVDRNVLRLSLFEMHFHAHPVAPKIVINEAIELAKRYGSTESGSFVNGILDSLQTMPLSGQQ